MITVIVGVKSRARTFSAEGSQCCGYSVRQGCVLTVNDQYAVGAYRSDNVAPCAFEHVDAICDGLGRDLHVSEAISSLCAGNQHQTQR